MRAIRIRIADIADSEHSARAVILGPLVGESSLAAAGAMMLPKAGSENCSDLMHRTCANIIDTRAMRS